MTLTAEAPAPVSLVTVGRLLVTVRDSRTRGYRAVGFLTQVPGGFEFAYLRRELNRPDFRPLPSLARAVETPAFSPDLFPIFAERVIAARRPDRQESLAALGLSSNAAPFEVLARSHGQRVGDTIEVLPAPDAAGGDPVAFTFLAHGIRHLPIENQRRISELRSGERLRLRPQVDNVINPRAQVVTDLGDVNLGWLPDPLIDVAESLDDRVLTVERANGPQVGFHFRLLVRIDGRVSANIHRLFSGPDWTI